MTTNKRLTPEQQDALEEREALRKLQFRRGKPIRSMSAPLSRTIVKSVLPQLKDTGVSVGVLATNWAEIVGPRLAGLTRPVKITRGKTGRVLVIEAPSAAAPMIQHQSGIIIQRAKLGGGGQIKAIRIQQTETPASEKKKAEKPRPALTEEQRAHLEEGLADMESDKLRAAFAKLGEAILTRR
ncbi:MAG: hypothetical protein CME88_15700 [Hirschia sp.]|nr:hypothetical protein [Hirschia sp.]MBF19823.1 hypothetical protein [Hirschia sp.]|tara:strand:+ start:166 stop:714 length:549 start_codon:yes stop_codon:yes gene_type:complete